jgi:inner membrane protein
MEPVTHFLTGACIGRAGFNRTTAYATLAAVLAAEAADLDILWSFAGPVEGMRHHRGITHTFWAVPVVAGVVASFVWLLDRWQAKRRKSEGGNAQQPIHWGWLYFTACIAALSHLLLDWTNNYGLRPFFPFSPHWYAGSFMFIAEPVIWAMLLLALFMPWVLGLADREIGARKQQFRGRGWAIFALCGWVVLGCWRWAEHAHALAMVRDAPISTEPVVRMAAEPYPVDLFRWHAIVETADYYQTAEINTRTGTIDSDPQRDVMYKPVDTPAVEAAKRTELGKVYLDWGTWAVVRDLGPVPAPWMKPPDLPPGRTWTTVEFTDLRFDYSFLPTRGTIPGTGGRPPLAGWVYIVDGHEDAGEAMNGREQR